MSSIIDRCAEIEAEEARKRVVVSKPSDEYNPVSSKGNQVETETKGGE